MDANDVLERLLEVLNRIDGRLKSIESSFATTQAGAPEHVAESTALLPARGDRPVPAESADSLQGKGNLDENETGVQSLEEHNTSTRVDQNLDSATEQQGAHSINLEGPQKGKGVAKESPPEPVTAQSTSIPIHDVHIQGPSPGPLISATNNQVEHHGASSSRAELVEQTDTINQEAQTEQNHDGLNDYYLKMPARYWNEFLGHESGHSYSSTPELEALWTELFGGFWTIPPDNRVDLAFQKHVLASLPPERAEVTTRFIRQWLELLRIADYPHVQLSIIDIGGRAGGTVFYKWPDPRTQRERMNSYTKQGIIFASPTGPEVYPGASLPAIEDQCGASWSRIM